MLIDGVDVIRGQGVQFPLCVGEARGVVDIRGLEARGAQARKHPLGVCAHGVGPDLHAVERPALRLRRGRVGDAEIAADTAGDGLTDLLRVFYDPAGRFGVVVKLRLDIDARRGGTPQLIPRLVRAETVGRAGRQRGQLVKDGLCRGAAPARIVPTENARSRHAAVEGVRVDADMQVGTPRV